MEKVRLYYSCLNPRNTDPTKTQVLDSLYKGIPDGLATAVKELVYKPSEVAVILGYGGGKKADKPNVLLKKLIQEKQKEFGKHILYVDSNLFNYNNPRSNYLRLCLNGVFPTTGTYFNDVIDLDHCNEVKKDLSIELKPWRTEGDHVLVCVQRSVGWSMGKTDIYEWLNETIHKIRAITDRPIVIRPHPSDRFGRFDDNKVEFKDISISRKKCIKEDLINAWCVVTYNSSPSVVSAVEGIPVFVTDPVPQRSQSYPIANTDLADIENPKMPDREDWLNSLLMSHHSFERMADGTFWKILQKYI